MSNTTDSHCSPPHIALFPCAGMGHLTPFLRLAAMLASRNCIVTLITSQPSVSAAESTHITNFFATYPHINRLNLQLLPYKPSNPTNDDPFFLQFEAINCSAHLLSPMLSSSIPPLSAILYDFAIATSFSYIAENLSIPNYIVSTTSARFHSVVAYLPHLTFENSAKFSGCGHEVTIPGLGPLPHYCIPPPFFNPNHPFTSLLAANARALAKAKGVLLNIFDWFDSETIRAANNGKVLANLPPYLPIGPFEPYELEKGHNLPWLNDQPAESVVYISFGSRTAVSKDQIGELQNGLEKSGCRFLWVLKANKLDKDDKEEMEELIGHAFLERTKDKGMVVKGWVNQECILAHPAIGGFVSHCGWNSVMEAAKFGVPILAWPQNGDQKVNAEVVEKARLGLWVRDWGWAGERLVKGEEIGEKVRELMGDEKLRAKARKVGEEARKAWEVGGSSDKVLMALIELLKPKERK